MSPPAGVVDGLLAGRYRLLARIGAGRSGEVWRALDERLDRGVAVKVLRPELAEDADVRARLRSQARQAEGLRHPGIAAVLDVAEDDDAAWVVTELVEGVPLSVVLREHGRLSVDRTLDVVEQAAAALHAAHERGVVHHHITGGELLLRPDGRLRITDFAVAHAVGAAAVMRTGRAAGAAVHLSPEQSSGRPVSAATDLHSLGVVAHECLSGTGAFAVADPVALLLGPLRTTPAPLPSDVPEPVRELVRRLMAPDPADRPAAAQVQQDAARLRRDVAARVTGALPTPSAATTARVAPALLTAPALGLAGRPGQRRAVRVTALALGLLAVVLGVRDAAQDDRTPDVPERRPGSSAPPVPGTTQDVPGPGDGG